MLDPLLLLILLGVGARHEPGCNLGVMQQQTNDNTQLARVTVAACDQLAHLYATIYGLR